MAKYLMIRLKTPSENIGAPKADFYPNNLPNMFSKFATSHPALTLKDLLEFLKRLVFKIAICMERYNYFKPNEQAPPQFSMPPQNRSKPGAKQNKGRDV